MSSNHAHSGTNKMLPLSSLTLAASLLVSSLAQGQTNDASVIVKLNARSGYSQILIFHPDDLAHRSDNPLTWLYESFAMVRLQRPVRALYPRTGAIVAAICAAPQRAACFARWKPYDAIKRSYSQRFASHRIVRSGQIQLTRAWDHPQAPASLATRRKLLQTPK